MRVRAETRQIVSWMLLFCLGWFCDAATAGETLPSVVRLGVIGALSGSKAPYGLSQLRGTQLAAEEINRRADTAVHLEIISRDDHGQMGRVGTLMTDLIYREGVLAVVGSTDSGCTHVMSMVCVKAQVPHFTCVSTDPSITRAGSPWTFRTLADDERQGLALLAHLGPPVPGQSLGVLAADSRYGKMGAKTLVRHARAQGFAISAPIWVPTETDDVSAAVSSVLAARPTTIILWTLAREGRTALQELKRRGFSGPILGGDGLATPAFYAAGLAETEGVILTCPYLENSPTPENTAFRQAYHRRWGTLPDSFAAHAYDTIRLLHAGIQLSDGSRQGLIDQVRRVVPFHGATGVLEFDPSGNDTRRVIPAVCRGGKLIPLGVTP